MSIGPGESFDVPVRLRLTESEKGEFERPVIVRFAGEPRLELTLKLKGDVADRWVWSTGTVIFDGIRTDEAASRTIELTRHPDAPAEEVTQVVSSSPGLFQLELDNPPAPDEAASYRVTVTTVPPLTPGRHEAALYAYTSDSTSPIGPVRVILIVEESTSGDAAGRFDARTLPRAVLTAMAARGRGYRR